MRKRPDAAPPFVVERLLGMLGPSLTLKGVCDVSGTYQRPAAKWAWFWRLVFFTVADGSMARQGRT